MVKLLRFYIITIVGIKFSAMDTALNSPRKYPQNLDGINTGHQQAYPPLSDDDVTFNTHKYVPRPKFNLQPTHANCYAPSRPQTTNYTTSDQIPPNDPMSYSLSNTSMTSEDETLYMNHLKGESAFQEDAYFEYDNTEEYGTAGYKDSTQSMIGSLSANDSGASRSQSDTAVLEKPQSKLVTLTQQFGQGSHPGMMVNNKGASKPYRGAAEKDTQVIQKLDQILKKLESLELRIAKIEGHFTTAGASQNTTILSARGGQKSTLVSTNAPLRDDD